MTKWILILTRRIHRWLEATVVLQRSEPQKGSSVNRDD